MDDARCTCAGCGHLRGEHRSKHGYCRSALCRCSSFSAEQYAAGESPCLTVRVVVADLEPVRRHLTALAASRDAAVTRAENAEAMAEMLDDKLVAEAMRAHSAEHEIARLEAELQAALDDRDRARSHGNFIESLLGETQRKADRAQAERDIAVEQCKVAQQNATDAVAAANRWRDVAGNCAIDASVARMSLRVRTAFVQ